MDETGHVDGMVMKSFHVAGLGSCRAQLAMDVKELCRVFIAKESTNFRTFEHCP